MDLGGTHTPFPLKASPVVVPPDGDCGAVTSPIVTDEGPRGLNVCSADSRREAVGNIRVSAWVLSPRVTEEGPRALNVCSADSRREAVGNIRVSAWVLSPRETLKLLRSSKGDHAGVRNFLNALLKE